MAAFVKFFARACDYIDLEVEDVLQELKQIAISNIRDLIGVPGFMDVLTGCPALAADSLVSIESVQTSTPASKVKGGESTSSTCSISI